MEGQARRPPNQGPSRYLAISVRATPPHDPCVRPQVSPYSVMNSVPLTGSIAT